MSGFSWYILTHSTILTDVILKHCYINYVNYECAKTDIQIIKKNSDYIYTHLFQKQKVKHNVFRTHIYTHAYYEIISHIHKLIKWWRYLWFYLTSIDPFNKKINFENTIVME